MQKEERRTCYIFPGMLDIYRFCCFYFIINILSLFLVWCVSWVTNFLQDYYATFFLFFSENLSWLTSKLLCMCPRLPKYLLFPFFSPLIAALPCTCHHTQLLISSLEWHLLELKNIGLYMKVRPQHTKIYGM